MQYERFQSVHGGRRLDAERVDIEDTIVVQAETSAVAPPSAEGRQEFEVVGIVEDAESSQRYAVCYSEAADEFIVTDEVGKLLGDDALAQQVLDDFLQQAADGEEEDGA